jgi:hypothetical protein
VTRQNAGVGNHDRVSSSDVAIGVVGPQDLVERIMMTGRALAASSTAPWRLLGAAYRDEHEAIRAVQRIQQESDVFLFTGPLPYDIVRAEDLLERPATYVPLSGASLFSTMIRALREHDVDLARVSIDSLTRADVEEAYLEIGVPKRRVKVREYAGPRSAASFASWHTELFHSGKTDAAFTTVLSVAKQLEKDSVRAFRVLPAAASLRVGLNTAALIGSHSRLAQAQIVIAIVGLPEGRGRAVGPEYWQHELRSAVHQVLLREARLMDATVLPRGDGSYFVAATLGSLEDATDDLRTAPFVAAVQEEVGVPVTVGIGQAVSAREAEEFANRALDKARSHGDAQCFLLRGDGSLLALPAHGARTAPPEATPPGKFQETVRRLIEGASDQSTSNAAPVVDAESAARTLDVSVRTARRTLGQLVEEGLAWPLPQAAPSGRGRPRQLYRLVQK